MPTKGLKQGSSSISSKFFSNHIWGIVLIDQIFIYENTVWRRVPINNIDCYLQAKCNIWKSTKKYLKWGLKINTNKTYSLDRQTLLSIQNLNIVHNWQRHLGRNMQYYGQAFRIIRLDHIRYEIVKEKAIKKENIVHKIVKWQLKWYGKWTINNRWSKRFSEFIPEIEELEVDLDDVFRKRELDEVVLPE